MTPLYTTTSLPDRAAARISNKHEALHDINKGAAIKKRELWDAIALLVERTNDRKMLKLVNESRALANEGKL